MREAIGGTWLFNLVIFFVLLFTGYMCLSINYSKAFNVKDKIINEIERNGGIKNPSDSKDPTISAINAYLSEVGYRIKSDCNGYEYGCKRNGNCVKKPNGSDYAFCISEKKTIDNYKHAYPGEYIYASYYNVRVFYQLDVPIIQKLFKLTVDGDTKLVYNIDNAKEG